MNQMIQKKFQKGLKKRQEKKDPDDDTSEKSKK